MLEADNLFSQASDRPEWWGAVCSAVAGISGIALVAVGAWQISAARDERRGWETLKACERYDTDPILDLCSRNLKTAKASGDLHIDAEKYSIDAISLLNYLEGIAAGVEDGLYVESIAKKHMQTIVKGLIERYISSEVATKMKIFPDEYSLLLELHRRWQR